MFQKLKLKYPDTEYPSNIGQKWSIKEETELLEELDTNIDIDSIAQHHNRTIGGINARRSLIAYKMFLNKNSIEEIINKTKLDKLEIENTIEIRQKIKTNKVNQITKPITIENEMVEMKNSIKELQHTIKELVELMKAAYEFENV